MLKDMINIFFLGAAELPAKLVGDIASFCYGASRAFENNDTNEDQE